MMTIYAVYAVFFLPLWIVRGLNVGRGQICRAASVPHYMCMQVLPALNEYVIARRCLEMHNVFASTGPVCGADDVSISAQSMSTWLMLACNIPSMLVVLPLGRMADGRGRRPLIIYCLVTQCFGSAGMLAVCLFQLDLLWMIPTYIINGFGGGSYTLQTILMASLADVAETREQRSALLARATASYYFCGSLGPVIGGYLSEHVVTVLPSLKGQHYQLAHLLFFSANLLVLALAIAAFHETLPTAEASAAKAPREERCYRRLSATFRHALQPLRSRPVVVLSITFMLLYATINSALSGLIVAYAKLSTFSLSDELCGWLIGVPWMIRAVSAAIILPQLLRFLTRRFAVAQSAVVVKPSAQSEPFLPSVPDRLGSAATGEVDLESLVDVPTPAAFKAALWCVRIGATISMIVFGCFGLANDTAALFVLCSIEGFASIWDAGASVLFSFMAERAATGVVVDGSNQGAFMGLRALLQTAMAVFGPLVFNGFYAATVAWLRPFTFYVLSAFCAAALAVTSMMRESDEGFPQNSHQPSR